MKHLNVAGKLFLSFCLLCAVVACSSDDDDKKTDSIVRQWQFQRYELNIEPSTPAIVDAVEEIINNLTDKDFTKSIATFKEDNTYTIVVSAKDSTNIDKGKYSLNGDKLILNPGKPGFVTLTTVSNVDGQLLVLDLDLNQLKDEYPEIAAGNLTKASVQITYIAFDSIK